MRERRVHDDTGGLVHGEQIVVFVQHLERDVFGRHDRPWRRLGQLNGDAIPERRPRGHAAYGRAVDRDQTVFDPRLHARPRRLVDIGEVSPQDEIETAARVTAIGVHETVHVWKPEPQSAQRSQRNICSAASAFSAVRCGNSTLPNGAGDGPAAYGYRARTRPTGSRPDGRAGRSRCAAPSVQAWSCSAAARRFR